MKVAARSFSASGFIPADLSAVGRWRSELHRSTRSRNSVKTLLVAWGVLVLSATNFSLHADGEVSVSPLAERSAPDISPPRSQEKDGAVSESVETPAAAPKPALGRLTDLPAVFRKTTPASLDDLKAIER